jgi:DNA gyrase subunit A
MWALLTWGRTQAGSSAHTLRHAGSRYGLQQPNKKSARIVGEVLGKYHPTATLPFTTPSLHGPDFSIRYMLVDGHGNFGSVDGDSAAAMRYTEVRMARIAEEMLADIDKDTVDFVPNSSNRSKNPASSQPRFPTPHKRSAGIAVGMATNIPPHNLGEVVDGIIKMIDNPEVTVNELMTANKGPDFPTGGLISARWHQGSLPYGAAPSKCAPRPY